MEWNLRMLILVGILRGCAFLVVSFLRRCLRKKCPSPPATLLPCPTAWILDPVLRHPELWPVLIYATKAAYIVRWSSLGSRKIASSLVGAAQER